MVLAYAERRLVSAPAGRLEIYTGGLRSQGGDRYEGRHIPDSTTIWRAKKSSIGRA